MKCEHCGMARWATLIEQRRSERPVILVDTGDFYPVREFSNQQIKDRYFFSAVNLLRYDAIAIGECETRNDAKRIMSMPDVKGLPFVSSNILGKRSGKPIADTYRICTFGERRSFFGKTGGWRVGIFSVAHPDLVYRFGDNPAGVYFVVDPKIAALEAVKALKAKGCSVIVGISHQGLDASRELALQVPGIDVVINAHYLSGLVFAERLGRTLLVDPGQKETAFTEIEVSWRKPLLEMNATNRCPELTKNPGDERFLKLEADYAKEFREAQHGRMMRKFSLGDTTSQGDSAATAR